MVSDYIDLLEKRLDLNMEVEFGITFDQALERGRAREIDLFPCLSQTPGRSEFLLFTEPYLSYPLVIIAREGTPLIGGLEDLRGKKVAVVKFLFIYSSLTHDHADLNLEFVETQNVGENLEAVSTGRADACIINLAVASYLIQKKRPGQPEHHGAGRLGTIPVAHGCSKGLACIPANSHQNPGHGHPGGKGRHQSTVD